MVDVYKRQVYYNKGFKRKTEPFFGQVDLLETYKKYAKPNGLLRKLRAKTCELCGACLLYTSRCV